jgi:hypothetical protein
MEALSSFALFIIAVILGFIFAVFFIWLTPYFPRLPLNAFFVSIIPLFSSFFFWQLTDDDKMVSLLSSSISFFIFGVFCSASLLAIGFVTSDIFLSLALLVLSTGAIGYLASKGLHASLLRAKVSIYAASLILLYELWLLAKQIIVVWDSMPIIVGRWTG